MVVVVLVAGISVVLLTTNPFHSSPTCPTSPTEFGITNEGATTSTEEFVAALACQAHVTLSDFALCVSNCVYTPPSLGGLIHVNGTSPLTTLLFYVNGTYEGTRTYSNNFTLFTIGFEASLNDSTMSMMANETYTIEFVAAFQSGAATVASTQVVAESGS